MKKPPIAVQGLRVRKKARQRNELLESATELFRQFGFENTRMEDIAVHASVSTKTVYNYFETKQQVLIELLSDDGRKMMASYQRVVDNLPGDLPEALAKLMCANVSNVRTIEEKKLWRELLSATIRVHDRPDDEFARNRKEFTGYIMQTIQHFRALGRLSTSLSLPLAADIVYAINAHNFRQYCVSDTSTPEDFLRLARRQMRQLVSPWLVPEDKPLRSGSKKNRLPSGMPAA